MPKHRLVQVISCFAAFAGFTLLVRPIYGTTTLKTLLSISGSDLPGRFKGALFEAFDVSPDGRILAAEFLSGEGQRSDGTRIIGVQVVEWDVGTSSVVRLQQVDGPSALAELRPNPQYTLNLRFTPDGKQLIAQTGVRIQILDASKLDTLYSISAPVLVDPAPKQGVAIRRFAVSGDSTRLGVLASPATAPCTPTNARLFDLKTGERIAEWGVGESCPYSISLSADGTQMLLSGMLSQVPPFVRSEVLLLDSRTGKSLRTFNVGIGTYGFDFMAGMAQFLGSGQFITGASASMNTPADVPQSRLRIFDLHTGQPLHDLTYANHGIRGYFEVAGNAPVVVVLGGGPRNAEDVLRDDDTPGFERLLLFHLNEKEPFYVSADRIRPAAARGTANYALPPVPLHISSDGKRLALFDRGTIRVYEITGAT